MQGHKRALNLVAEAQALSPEARAEIAALERAAFESADLREGMAAFAEKRAPNSRAASQAQIPRPGPSTTVVSVMEGRGSQPHDAD